MRSFTQTLASCSLACVLAIVAGCGDESGTGAAGAGAGATSASGPVGSGSSSTTTTQGPATGSSTTGQGGAGGGSTPSPGCGLADPPTGEQTIDVGGVTGDYVISVPVGYDP